MAEVRFEAVSKIYPDGTRAVSRMSLEIADREFMVLVGPSGCGTQPLTVAIFQRYFVQGMLAGSVT